MKYPAEHRTWVRNNPIKQARRMAGLHSNDLANTVGVRDCTFRRWECGMRRPTLEHLEQTARALGIEPTTLVKEYEIWRALRP